MGPVGQFPAAEKELLVGDEKHSGERRVDPWVVATQEYPTDCGG